MIDPKWIEFAKKEVGTKEGTGALNNPKVVSYWKDAQLSWIKDDSTPWCAGFVNAMLERSGVKGTRKANARSFLTWGINVYNGFLSTPYYGSIVIFSRPPSIFNGHVGFLIAHDKDNVLVLGGNQGDKVSYAVFPKSRVIGLRYPTLPNNDMFLKQIDNLKGYNLSTSEA